MVYKSDRSFYRFVTIHACDRRTDRILITIPRLHYMQRGKKQMIIMYMVKLKAWCYAVTNAW